MMIRRTARQRKIMGEYKYKKKMEELKGKQIGLGKFQPKTEENTNTVPVPDQKVPQEMKGGLDVNGQPKLKSKAEVRKSIKINAQVQVLNGEHCIRYKNVPTILLDMRPPKDYHEMAQNQNFAMWFKLEDKEYMNVAKQLKPHLKELTFWFNKEDEERLSKFLNRTDDSDFDETEINRDETTGRMIM